MHLFYFLLVESDLSVNDLMKNGGNLGLVAGVVVTLLIIVELGEARPVIRKLIFLVLLDKGMLKELLDTQAPSWFRL